MYFKNLDPLRGFLALLVVFFHVGAFTGSADLPDLHIWPILHKGEEAVLVFFSLSGYLIIGLLHDEKKRTGTIAVKQFYIRRILRLYPVYYLVLATGLLVYFLVLPKLGVLPSPEYGFFEALFFNLAMMPNVLSYYYDLGMILEVMWSIGIEEQFYILVAPLLYLLPLKHYLKSLIAFTLIYFFIFHVDQFTYLRHYIMVFFFMSGGGLMAVLQRRGIFTRPKSKFVRYLIYGIFLLMFTTDYLDIEHEMLRHGFFLVMFSIFIATLANSEMPFQIPRWATWLGKISYGIYMYHMIVVYVVFFVSAKIHAAGLVPDAVIIAINWLGSIFGTLLVSHLSYNYYEKFFLRLKDRFRVLN